MKPVLLAALLPAVLAVPYLLPQCRLRPTTGIALWLSVLVLRATTAAALAALALFYFPGTDLFRLLTHWCLHTVFPYLTTHLGLDGHRLGDAATLIPGLLSAGFVISFGFGVWRAASAAATWMRHNAIGSGPGQSVIVSGSEVMVAATGLTRPQVIVSAGALVRLDDSELAAGLEHEWGHITRRHRYLVLFGQMCHCASRFLPGGRAAQRALSFQLERDADAYAVRRTGDRLALASAISRVACGANPRPTPALVHLSETGVAARVRSLIGESEQVGTLAQRTASVLALVSIALTLLLAVSMPSIADAGAARSDRAEVLHAHACPS